MYSETNVSVLKLEVASSSLNTSGHLLPVSASFLHSRLAS